MIRTPLKWPLDLLDFSSVLTEEEREIQATVAEFLADRVRPHLAEWFERTPTSLVEITPELGKLGVLDTHLDGYGCAGTNAVSYGLACLEPEAADSGFRWLHLRTGIAVHVLHLEVGLRGAEAPVAVPARRR